MNVTQKVDRNQPSLSVVVSYTGTGLSVSSPAGLVVTVLFLMSSTNPEIRASIITAWTDKSAAANYEGDSKVPNKNSLRRESWFDLSISLCSRDFKVCQYP